ncbi:MAG: DUF1684 domain-containing protein [Oceanihabitans sp.]
MKKLLYLFIIISFTSCMDKKQPVLGDTTWQKKQNADFKDASKSPLKDKDRKDFKTLDFFDFDSTYVVTATLEKTPNSNWFEMETTTSRVSEERIFGIATFNIKGKTHQLNIYQGKEHLQKEGFEDYLFLPFIDETNGEQTYGGGRYLDLRIPENNTIIIDFNKAYNPYCAYNEKYSCPIVPLENEVTIPVEAGVKAFIKK